MALPKNFVDLSAAYDAAVNSSFIGVIGVVIDLMRPTTTSSKEHMLTMTLLDPKLRDAIYGNTGLKVRLFTKAGLDALPPVRNIGDIILIRRIKKVEHAGMPLLVTSVFPTSEILVFPAASIPDPNFSIAYMGDKSRLQALGPEQHVRRMTNDEQNYVIHLHNQMKLTVADAIAVDADRLSRKRVAEPLPQPLLKKSKVSSAVGPKFRLVEELQHRMFADIVVQIVKKFYNQYGDCELYVTDYTENKNMFYYVPPDDQAEHERDGDTFGYNAAHKQGWRGPWGQRILKIRAKEPHASYINAHIREGEFVLIRNLNAKAKEGFKLEGELWPDQSSPEKLQVHRIQHLDHPEIQALEERKRKYWLGRGPQDKALAVENGVIESSKTEKKRRKKQQKILAKETTAGLQVADGDSARIVVGNAETSNPHIRTRLSDSTIIRVRDILDPDNLRHTAKAPSGERYVVPFVNASYRAKVKVVDFEPKDVIDFAVPALNENDDSMEIDYDASQSYEWFFALQLEDATMAAATKCERERFWVQVHHSDAQYLLGDMDDPCDLRQNAQLLVKLKEKLYIMWGNLEEKDEKTALQNRPLEACIHEYGAALDDDDPTKSDHPFGFVRMFALFDTTIK